MKNSPFEELITNAGREITLSADERAHMLSVLREHIASNPIASRPQLTAYQAMIAALSGYARRPSYALAAIILIVAVSGGGLAFAAEGSLPGDPLYAVKVDVTEPLLTTLTLSPAGKIAWQQTLAERRLDEALALANEGKLATTTEVALASDFTEHANAAVTVSATTSASTETTPVDFAAQLSAYQNILTAQAGLDHGRSATSILQNAIHTQLALLASTTPELNPNANHLQIAARISLDDSARLIGSVNTTLSTSSSKDARGALDRARALTSRGNDLLQQNDTEGASQAFQDSLAETARLDIFTHAAATLHIDAFDLNATSTATTTPSTATSTPAHNGKSHTKSPSGSTPVSSSASTTSAASPTPSESSVTSTTAVGAESTPVTPPLPVIPVKL